MKSTNASRFESFRAGPMRMRTFTGLAILAIVFYFAALAHLGLNIPVEDDVEFLRFIVIGESPSGDSAGLARWWSQHNEHRPIVPRAIFTTVMAAQGHVDFRTVLFLGNSALLATVALLFAWLPPAPIRERLALWAPIPIILFTLQHWQAMTWATGASQHYPLLLCALLTFHLLAQPTPSRIAIGAALASAAFFNLGAGLFVFVIGAALLARARAKWGLAAFAGWGALNVAMYFIGYERPDHHPSISAAFLDPIAAFDYFCTLLGGSFSFHDPMVGWLARFFGLAGLVYFADGLRAKTWDKQPRLFAAMSFLLLTLAAVTVARVGFGHDQAYDSRYRVYSHLYFALVYASVICRVTAHSRVRANVAGLVVALSLNVASLSYFEARIAEHNAFYTKNLKEWAQGETVIPGPARYSRIVAVSLARGLYEFPCDALRVTPKDAIRFCKNSVP